MRKNTEFEHGDLRKIAYLTGFSYDYVRRVLVYGNRHNTKITLAARQVKESNEDLKSKIIAA